MMPPGTVSDLSRNVTRLKALTGINGESRQTRAAVEGNDNAPQVDELLLLLQKQDQVILQMQQELYTYEADMQQLRECTTASFENYEKAIRSAQEMITDVAAGRIKKSDEDPQCNLCVILQNRVEELKRSNEKLQRELDEQSAISVEKSSKQGQAAEEARQAVQRAITLEAEKTALEQRLEAFHKQLEKSIAEAQQQVCSYRVHVQSEQLHISHTSYTAMKGQLDELSSQHGVLVAEKNALNAEVQELRAALSAARNSNAALEMKVNTLENSEAQLRATIDATVKQREDAKEEIAALKSSQRNAEKEFQDVKRRLEETNKKCTVAVKKEREKCADAMKRNDQLTNENAQLHASNARLNTEIAELRATFTSRINELSNAMHRHAEVSRTELERLVVEQRAVITQLKIECQQHVEEIKQLRQVASGSHNSAKVPESFLRKQMLRMAEQNRQLIESIDLSPSHRQLDDSP